MTKSTLLAILTITLLLAACTSAAPAEPTAPPTPTVDPAFQPFVDLAAAEPCARDINRLFLLNGEYIVWHRADAACPDNTYGMFLYGLTPSDLRCSNTDTIAGPQLTCSDFQSAPLFSLIVPKIELPGFGLGQNNTVTLLWTNTP